MAGQAKRHSAASPLLIPVIRTDVLVGGVIQVRVVAVDTFNLRAIGVLIRQGDIMMARAVELRLDIRTGQAAIMAPVAETFLLTHGVIGISIRGSVPGAQ